MGTKYSDHVVEDGFSYEGGGITERTFLQMFAGIPRDMLQRLLSHFRDRKEWEVVRIIKDLMNTSDNMGMA